MADQWLIFVILLSLDLFSSVIVNIRGGFNSLLIWSVSPQYTYHWTTAAKTNARSKQLWNQIIDQTNVSSSR